jgi:hypothetical protein
VEVVHDGERAPKGDSGADGEGRRCNVGSVQAIEVYAARQREQVGGRAFIDHSRNDRPLALPGSKPHVSGRLSKLVEKVPAWRRTQHGKTRFCERIRARSLAAACGVEYPGRAFVLFRDVAAQSAFASHQVEGVRGDL